MEMDRLIKRCILGAFLLPLPFTVAAQRQTADNTAPTEFNNPILAGFSPDPSICRVGDDFYLVNSSFTWYPGIPVYHSKDLVNWKLIGHAIDRPDMIDMEGLSDNDGIWAVTIRHHDGVFYLITTASKCGGNFYLTATDPRGPWSDPIWLKDAPGIDPSLFWDDDGRCYYTGNCWDFPKAWPSQCAVWTQELDLQQQKLTGERKILAYGHANNATYAEGPHLYKHGGKYMLLMAEGGTDRNHAVTVNHSDSLWGPYVSDVVNPVLTHRHLGRDYLLQAIGHADLVDTPQGDWWSVVLGKRMVDGRHNPLSRETFLCKVDFEGDTPIYNAGEGKVLLRQQRPDLPWTPVEPDKALDDFKSDTLAPYWYFVRIPRKPFFQTGEEGLTLTLQPAVIDSLTNAAMLLRKVKTHKYTATTRLVFSPRKENEQAGIVLYRTANGYFALLREKDGLALVRKDMGNKETLERVPYQGKEVLLSIEVDGMNARFRYGDSKETMQYIGGTESLDAISDNAFNKFNGPGIGMYATSNGKATKQTATFSWFELR